MDEKKFNRLLKGLRAKDSCFGHLYKFYYPKIVFYVTRVYGYADLAEDVAQEFFRALLGNSRLPEYVPSPTVWVMQCCDNIVESMIDGTEYELRRANVADMEAAEDVARLLDPDLADSRELLKVLDETTERIVVMHVCEGYGLKEISEMLGLGYDAVRQRYSRGLRRMRRAGEMRNGDCDT